MAGENLTGSYISQVFDSGNDAVWNNVSWVGNNPSVESLYAVDGGGDVYKSVDLGENWVLSQEDFGRATATEYMFSNNNYLYILSTTGNEVWNSSNGTGFVVVYNDFDSKSPYVGDSDNNSNLYVATGPGEVWKSDDNGLTWTLKGDFNPGIQTPKGISIDSDGYIYTVDGTGDIYKSTNDGVDWTKVNDGYGGSTGTDGMDEDSNDNLYILMNYDFYKSSDSGVTWEIINDSITPYANILVKILIDDNDNFFILDTVGRVFKSNDYGINWVEIGDCNNDASNDPAGITDFVQATNLSFQVRTCNDEVCSGESWIDIIDTSPQDLSLDDNSYFQYKVDFTSPDSSVSPSLESVDIDYDLLDFVSPSISYSSSTTSEGNHLADSINVGVDLSDESQMYSFINFNNSLVGFWKMNESSGNILDYSGYGNDGTNNGAEYSVAGKFGKALEFDGLNDYLDFSRDNFDFPLAPFTISFWARENIGASDDQVIIGTYYNKEIIISGQISGVLKFWAGGYNAQISANKNANEWHHIVFLIDSLGNRDVYIDNGKSSWTGKPLPVVGSQNFQIGSGGGYSKYFNGSIDEVLIFNRVLLIDEISALNSASSYSKNFTELEQGDYNFYAYIQDTQGNENQTETRVVTLNEDINPPSISYSSSTTSEGDHLADSINVGVDLSDESQMYSFINFNNSLVGFWKMNESSGNILDYSGYGNDGTPSGGVTYGVDGKSGDALSFDGNDDVIEIQHSAPISINIPYSISAWIKPSDVSGMGIITSKDEAVWEMMMAVSNGGLYVGFENCADDNFLGLGGTIIVDNWQHVAYVYNGSRVFGYIDGVEVVNVDGSGTPCVSGYSLGIGDSQHGISYPFSGAIDEVIIFNRVLSSDEVSALYSASSYSHNFTNLEAGGYSFYAYTQDTQGNENQTETRAITLVDNVAPSITFVSPQNGASYGYNESLALDFIASDSDGNLDSCWYNIDSGDNVSLEGCANTIIDVPEGENTLIVYANDSEGEKARDSVIFNVAVGAPTIVLHSPIDDYFSSGENTEFNYTPIDIDLDSCWLLGDFDGEFKINQTDNSPMGGSINSFIIESLNDGDYLWNIGCNDSQGNLASNGNKTFYVDSISPEVSISEPVGEKTSRIGISLSFSVSDNNLDSCWYNIYRGDSLEVVNTSINCSESSSFDVTVDADFVLNFYVNDSSGNTNQTSSIFSVDTTEDPVIPPVDDGASSGGGGGGGGSFNYTPPNLAGKFEVSKIGDIIAREGEKKTLSLNAKNIGKGFLNNCKLVINGDISSWIRTTQVEGIAPGQSIDFVFDLTIPEEVQSGDYNGELEIKCDENSDKQEMSISIPEGLQVIKINEISHEEDGLNISYDFDHSSFIGDSISVEIWIVNEDGVEVKRVTDSFDINKDGVIKRDVLMELPEDLAGIYSVYFALSSELNNFVRQSVVLGKSVGTVRAVLGEDSGGKAIAYGLFIIVVIAGIFFIVRKSIFKPKELKISKNNKKSKKGLGSDGSESIWLFGRKDSFKKKK